MLCFLRALLGSLFGVSLCGVYVCASNATPQRAASVLQHMQHQTETHFGAFAPHKHGVKWLDIGAGAGTENHSPGVDFSHGMEPFVT